MFDFFSCVCIASQFASLVGPPSQSNYVKGEGALAMMFQYSLNKKLIATCLKSSCFRSPPLSPLQHITPFFTTQLLHNSPAPLVFQLILHHLKEDLLLIDCINMPPPPPFPQDCKEDLEGAKCFYVGDEEGDSIYYIAGLYRCEKC